MSDATLDEAAAQFLETVKGPGRQQALAVINRFVTWWGDRPTNKMTGHDIATYGESLGPATPETQKRGEYIRQFLNYLRKNGVLEQNLAPHLRLKKAGKAAASAHHSSAAHATVELTQSGIDALKAELEGLMQDRIAVREDIRKAMLDKDFRENSPLDAAKDKQGHIEARIREIEAMLKRAVVVDDNARTGRVRVGSIVKVKNPGNGKTMEYSIVGPTEANAAEGKISSVSPVGKALLDCVPGDEVEVSVPSGTLRLQVESVNG
jgi:transcription elongation factor GreA